MRKKKIIQEIFEWSLMLTAFLTVVSIILFAAKIIKQYQENGANTLESFIFTGVVFVISFILIFGLTYFLELLLWPKSK